MDQKEQKPLKIFEKRRKKQGLKGSSSENVLTLGSQPMEPVTKENRSINYDPIVHKYIGEPRTTTDLQRRAKKERTGYVTIAGGRKDLAEDMRTCDALQSTMQGYVEYEHQKVDPVQTWLVDEQQAATGGLRTFPAQKGVSPLTRRLVQAHPNSRVRDWHVNDQQRAAKLKQITDVFLLFFETLGQFLFNVFISGSTFSSLSTTFGQFPLMVFISGSTFS